MAVLSDDPNQTSGKARNSISSHSYPLNETLSSATRLKFVRYNRFNPADDASEEVTAVITLPLPVTIPDNYSIRTSGHDLGVFGNVNNDNWSKIKGLANNTSNDPIQDMKDMTELGVSTTAQRIRSRTFSAAAALAGIGFAVNSSDFQNTVQSFGGVVRNPHTTIVFEGVNLRSINLEWRLSPRSQKETDALQNIFNTIKLQSHPEELASGFALNYPDLVYFEFTGKIEKYAPKFQKSFITNINLLPDTTNGMTLYKSGAPAIYTLQISAMELSIITRDTLQEQINGAQ